MTLTLFKTAKDVSEGALRLVGAFPPSRQQADEGELRVTLGCLESLLNHLSGIRPLVGYWEIIDIPVEAGVGDYILSDYADSSQIQHVFSASYIGPNGDPEGLLMRYESEMVEENFIKSGTPARVVVTRDQIPVLRLFPTPTQQNEDDGGIVRVRVQVYEQPIDRNGSGNTPLRLRPAWYLFIENRLAYEIGKGPVRRLSFGVLDRLKEDARTMESELLARDGQQNSGKPPTVEPMVGA